MKTVRLVLLFMVLAGVAFFLFGMHKSDVKKATVVDVVRAEDDSMYSYIFEVEESKELVHSYVDTREPKLKVGDTTLIEVDDNYMAVEAHIELYSLAFSFVSAFLWIVFMLADSKMYVHKICVK